MVIEKKKCNTVEPLFMTSLGKSSPFPLAIPSNEFKPLRIDLDTAKKSLFNGRHPLYGMAIEKK